MMPAEDSGFRDSSPQIGFPEGDPDEKRLLVKWLKYLRRAVLRNLDGLDEDQARWTPGDKLLPLLGIIHHLTCVEWRWIEGGFRGADVSRDESEFQPSSDLSLVAALANYHVRATNTDDFINSHDLGTSSDSASWAEGHDLRWVVLHLINETARDAGHADATRELLDGRTGE